MRKTKRAKGPEDHPFWKGYPDLSTPERIVAKEFCKVLRTTHLTEDEMRLTIERNRRENNPSVCHSHDFCDANEAMMIAFENIGVLPPILIEEWTEEHEKACNLWNAAWDLAKQAEFAL